MRPATELIDEGRRIRAREQQRLEPLLPGVELRLTGGSSLPGAITGGDIDLHCRVTGDFDHAVSVLTDLYVPVKAEIWGPTLATFEVPDELPVGLAATPVGSEHDRFFLSSWAQLAAEPGLLEEYNALKRTYHGTDVYEEKKAEFFGRLGGYS
ncbi:hypothetical protein [Pseudactinotalea suaedae]|uniref:hypothetical protein n=1 Tax=Pseudactinotalea suaedae TaxID=1524924 RepID=UPI0012E23170|nr:hypothetical protein [Pseudactinotalea suaedae]